MERMGIPQFYKKPLYTLFFAEDQVVLVLEHEDFKFMTKKLTKLMYKCKRKIRKYNFRG